MNRAVKWGIGLVLVPLLLLGGIALALQMWVGSDDFRQRVAQQASQAVGVPVEIGGLSVSVWPLPAVAARDVRVQSKPPLALEQIEARPTWAALLGGRLEIATLLVRNAVIPHAAIGAVAEAMRKQNARSKPSVKKEPSDPRALLASLPKRVVLDHVTWVDAKGNQSVVDAQARLDEDALPGALDVTVREGRFVGTELAVRREMQNQAERWAVNAKLGGGAIKGALVPQKGTKGGPLLVGDFVTSGVEVAQLTAPSRTLTGKLEADTKVQADLRDLGGLTDSLRTQTKFTVRNAVLHGIDLAQAVRTVGMNKSGQTHLDTLAGNVATHGLQVNLTNLVASSGALSASGAVAISPDKKLSGSMNVNLTAQAVGGALGVPLVVGGTLDSPSVTLSRGALAGAAIGTLIAPGVGTGAGASVGDRLGQSLKGLFGK